MKAKELRQLNETELTAKEAELRTNLMKLYGQVSTGTPPKNPGEIRRSKRVIAQILTIRNEKLMKKTATANKPAQAKPGTQAPAGMQPAPKSQSPRKMQSMEARPKQ